MPHPLPFLFRAGAALCVIVATLLLAGCNFMKPLDEGSWAFIMGRSYSSTEHRTTILTTRGETISAAPLCARVYDLTGDKSLRLTLDNTFAIPFSDIRAISFDTPVRITTMSGAQVEAAKGAWWFLVHKGRVDSWTDRDETRSAVDSAGGTVIRSKQIRDIDVGPDDPLATGVLYGVTCCAIAAGIAIGIAATK